MSALASAVHQRLQSGLVSQYLHVFPPFLTFEFTSPKTLRQCRVLLLLTRAPGFLELFTRFRRARTRTHNTAEDLGWKGDVEPDQEISPLTAVCVGSFWPSTKESKKQTKKS